jgi:hypothetical protein
VPSEKGSPHPGNTARITAAKVAVTIFNNILPFLFSIIDRHMHKEANTGCDPFCRHPTLT